MSWARDEWKQDLPSVALKKITELESETENLRKSKQQQQFQLDSVSAILQKQKQLNSDEKASNASLRREIQTLSRKCFDLESQEEKLQHDLNSKRNKIELLEEQLEKLKSKLRDEEERNNALLQELDRKQLQVEGSEGKIGRLSDELEKAACTKAQVTKELDAANEKLATLSKENDILRDQLRERDEVLTKHTNSSIEKETELGENTADQEIDSIASAFVEILKRENNALISENEKLNILMEHLKGAMREKERELERVMEKLAASHAESEKTVQALQLREREIGKLKEDMARNLKDGRVHQIQNQTELLEGKNRQLFEENESFDNRNAMKTEDGSVILTKALEDAKNTIETLNAELHQKEAQLKAKNTRIGALEEENAQLRQQAESLKRQNNAGKESHTTLSRELSKKELKIAQLEGELTENKQQLRERGEKIEMLLTENRRLTDAFEASQSNLKETKQSYRSISKALEVSRMATKDDLTDIGQAFYEGHDGESLERRVSKDGEEPGNKQKEKATAQCRSCDHLKAKLSEQTDHYESQIRELEAVIRDLKTEKEVLEKTVIRQRRRSEEFASRVEEMMKGKLDTNTGANERTRKRNQLQEKEQFIVMVQRFFKEHEGLKDQAMSCLRDIYQVQRYFQSCSAQAQSLQAETLQRMSLLKSLLESVVNEFAQPLKIGDTCSGERSSNDNSADEENSREEMFWDDYEEEVAFQAFKGDVDVVLKDLDIEKKRAEKKAEELYQVKRAQSALKKVRRKSRSALERALAKVDEEEENVPEREYHVDRSSKEEMKHIMKYLLQENKEELESKMNEQFKRLENIIMRQRAFRNACLDENRQQMQPNSFHKNKESIEGMYAIEELDIVKRKLSDVQTSMRHLLGALAERDKEKTNAESKISLLSEELERKECQFEARCEDLTRAAKAASDQQLALRSRVDTLASERDELHAELRRVVEELRQKELTLVAKSQQLKHLQNEQKEDERMTKNKIASLEQENEGLWMDYKEASKRAETKEKEFKELADRLKSSQGYLNSLFTSLSNMDDELQRARDIEVLSERD